MPLFCYESRGLCLSVPDLLGNEFLAQTRGIVSLFCHENRGVVQVQKHAEIIADAIIHRKTQVMEDIDISKV